MHKMPPTNTHTRLTALCPGLPRWASTRKVKPIWILLKQETVGGSGTSWAIMQVCTSLQTDNHTSTPPLLCFLQAGCPSCRPTNSVKALKATSCRQPTIQTKHYHRSKLVIILKYILAVLCQVRAAHRIVCGVDLFLLVGEVCWLWWSITREWFHLDARLLQNTNRMSYIASGLVARTYMLLWWLEVPKVMFCYLLTLAPNDVAITVWSHMAQEFPQQRGNLAT